MRFTPILLLSLTVLISGCTTLANRRDLYFPEKVNGPYTRMKAHGIPSAAPVQGTVQGGTSDGKRVVNPAR